MEVVGTAKVAVSVSFRPIRPFGIGKSDFLTHRYKNNGDARKFGENFHSSARKLWKKEHF
jgi:hypothetical protein